MRKLKIILDSDEVLAQTMRKVLHLYNKEYGQNFGYDDVLCWDLSKIQLPGTDMQKYFTYPNFFADLEPMKDSQEYVGLLLEQGHDVLVATASSLEGMVDKKVWVNKHFGIPLKNIFVIDRKDVLAGDIILDDGIHNLTSACCGYPILFDRQWNKNEPGFVRALDWPHFYELVQKISEGYSYMDLLAKGFGNLKVVRGGIR